MPAGVAGTMGTIQINVERFSVTSSKSFDDVVAALSNSIGHPDMERFRKDVTAARTFAELEGIVAKATGPSGLMQFVRLDLGEILRKEQGEKAPRSLRLLVGNPIIMKRMLKYVPDVGSYAPVSILIDERSNGVHLSYDRMESFLASYGSMEALAVARELDSKIETLLNAAATS
jgi:uncharacterized protein (DUF302 family)